MTDSERKVRYYVWEIEMSDDFANHLRKIAAKENMTLEEMTEKGLMHIIENPETLTAWKAELDALPQEQKSKLGKVKILRIYPVHIGETEAEARARAIMNENKTLPLREMTQQEFCDHIEDDDFFLVYGNPVVVNGDDGQKLVCMAWPMAERILRMTGRGLKLMRSSEKPKRCRIIVVRHNALCHVRYPRRYECICKDHFNLRPAKK